VDRLITDPFNVFNRFDSIINSVALIDFPCIMHQSRMIKFIYNIIHDINIIFHIKNLYETITQF
jgi:hypothetical protein